MFFVSCFVAALILLEARDIQGGPKIVSKGIIVSNFGNINKS